MISPPLPSPSGAPEHALQSLAELTAQSGKIGQWMLRVCGTPDEHEYKYTYQGKPTTGKVLVCHFVSTVSSQYCLGKFKRKGKEPAASSEFLKAFKKFNDQTIWKVSKVSFTNDKQLYTGSPIKVVIDMNATTFQPVLQSTVAMPVQATPPEELATLLESPANQRVDVLALLVSVSDERSHTTAFGPRKIVDVTIRDLSGPTGASECQFAIFFKGGGAGSADLTALRCACTDGAPVAFFNLVVAAEAQEEKKTLKTAVEGFMWKVCRVGDKAAELLAAADALKSRAAEQVTRVMSIPEFVPQVAVDYLDQDATLSVCRLLQEVMRRSPEDIHDSTLFQLNYVRIKEPQPGESPLTKGGDRLFPKVDVVDFTAQLELRMREKVALSLSDMDKEEFVREVECGGINFPPLCSARVLVRKTPAAQGSAAEASTGGGALEHYVSAIIVEAVEQEFEMPKAMPNASMTFVNDLLNSLPPAPGRMIVAPLGSVRISPHAGMLVEGPDGVRHACGCVLSLVAHTGKSKIDDLPNGHRIASKECWDVPFASPPTQPDGAPEHASAKLAGMLASYCSLSNVQFFTLSARKAKEPVYAMVVVVSAHDGEGGTTFMVDKVHVLDKDRVNAMKPALQKLNIQSLRYRADGQAPAATIWEADRTPFNAKKTRRLSYSPTDASMD
jgi:hypothetical protein